MKKIVVFAFIAAIVLLTAAVLSGCAETAIPDIGIQSIEKTDTVGLVDTYTITLTDGTTASFDINNGENGHTPTVEIGKNGNWFVDGVDTEVQAQAQDGEKGLSAYELYVKYHPEYTGSEQEWVETFYPTPTTPNEIVGVAKTSSEGLVDTYTITFSDGSTTTFTVTNGEDGEQGETGNGVAKIEKTGTEGLVDTYTITFTDGSTTTFDINNGDDGRTPTIEIGENGNWIVNGVDTKVQAQAQDGDAGLSAYEIYLKYHPEYEGSEEEWTNEFFHKENDLEIFVRQMDVSSYTVEMKEYYDGVLGNDQVFAKSKDMRYWQRIYNEYDEETGEYYPYPTQYYFTTQDNDETTPESLLYWKQRDNVWYEMSDASDIYMELNQCHVRHYQYAIDTTQFDQVTSTYYRAKSDCVTEVGKAFLYDMDTQHWGELDGKPQKIWRTEVFYTFELEIVSGNLKVRATSHIEDGDDITDVTYELVLSKMGVTTLSLPEYSDIDEEDMPYDAIADCYEKSQGEEVINLWCIVTGYIQLNDTDWKVWVTDYGFRDILVVFRGFGFPYGVEQGRDIVVYGTIDIVDGIYTIQVTRRVDYELQGCLEYANPCITYLSEITEQKVNTVVDLEGVVIDKVALDGEGVVSMTDHDGNTMELRVAQNEVAIFNAMCAGQTAGEQINLNNLAIAKDETGLYACLTKQSNIILEYGLLLNYTEKTVKESLSMEDALTDLVVHYRGEDNRYVLLDASDYTLTCENFDSTKNGVYEVTVAYEEAEAIVTLIFYLPQVREHVSYATIEETAKEKLDYVTPALPSTGNVNILVIPIGFTNTDYSVYGDEAAIKSKLEVAFNDTTGQTGWYSLKEYYLAASYGQLNITANILDIYQTGVDYDMYSGETGVDDVAYMMDALAYYDDQIDYSEYDQNEDWNIDCIFIVYLAPIYDDLDDQSDLWWAYYFYTDGYESFDNTYVCGYLWMSIEFFDLPINIEYTGLGTIDTENSLYVNINCETVIHEAGHALGLDDYYDYADGGVKGGVGGFAMMDANQGDHDPYSKAILGWTTPTVVVDMDYETTLRSFESSGDTIILSKTNGGTYFEEYYMIAFYTPTGVNELKKDCECGLPSVSGVMVWHIDATLRSMLWRVGSVIDITEYNNGNAARKLIDLVCGDGSTNIDRFVDYVVKDTDLFVAGSTISGLKWYDGTDVGAEITIGTFEESEGVEYVTIGIDY